MCHLWGRKQSALCVDVCASVSVPGMRSPHVHAARVGRAVGVAGVRWHEEDLRGGPGPHRPDMPGPDS